MRRLPPLSAIRVFEAAGRHEHFTAAAAELGMTQAAVSYQIRLLEERVGVALFERARGRVKLTDAGRRLLGPVSDAFDRMDAAFAGLRSEDESLLTISTTQTFANTWLAWRIGAFQMANPAMAVRLDTSDRMTDFAGDSVDLAIRAGRGDWAGVVVEPLFPIDFTPMCSPAFLERHGGRLEPADLLRLPLIGPDDRWWTDWLTEAGVSEPHLRQKSGIRLDSQASEGHAAMAGQGMALLTPFFWRNDLADGRLVRPFAQVSAGDYGYWLVYPEHRRNTPKIRRFRDWLLPLVRQDRDQPDSLGVVAGSADRLRDPN